MEPTAPRWHLESPGASRAPLPLYSHPPIPYPSCTIPSPLRKKLYTVYPCPNLSPPPPATFSAPYPPAEQLTPSYIPLPNPYAPVHISHPLPIPPLVHPELPPPAGLCDPRPPMPATGAGSLPLYLTLPSLFPTVSLYGHGPHPVPPQCPPRPVNTDEGPYSDPCPRHCAAAMRHLSPPRMAASEGSPSRTPPPGAVLGYVRPVCTLSNPSQAPWRHVASPPLPRPLFCMNAPLLAQLPRSGLYPLTLRSGSLKYPCPPMWPA